MSTLAVVIATCDVATLTPAQFLGFHAVATHASAQAFIRKLITGRNGAVLARGGVLAKSMGRLSGATIKATVDTLENNGWWVRVDENTLLLSAVIPDRPDTVGATAA